MIRALRVVGERHGTRVDLLVWVDTDKGTAGIAWPNILWSAGDLTPKREGLAFWLECAGLTRLDAEVVAELAPLGWWALAGDEDALAGLRAAPGVRSVSGGEP